MAGRLQVRLILTVLLLVFVVFLPIPLILCVVIRIIVLLLRSLLLLHRGVGRLQKHRHKVVTSIQFSVLAVSDVCIPDRKGGEEIHKEGAVEVLAELVEHKPVSEFAVADEELDLPDLGGLLEVAVHPHVDQLVPHTPGAALEDPVYEPEECNVGDESKPPPDHQEHLVVYHVEGEDADGVDGLLLAPPTPTSSTYTKLFLGRCSTWD